MSGGKKHPLEIFKSSGRSLGGRRPNGTEDTGDEESPAAPVAPARKARDPAGAQIPRGAMQSDPARPVSEFELRLSLPGALVLLFSWVILMGGAYLYGHSRGRDGFLEERDQAALALGRQIESRPAAPASTDAGSGRDNSEAGARPRPWGVLLVTYNGYQGENAREIDERINAMARILRERYHITAPLQSWQHKQKGQLEVFAGVFDSDEDPELKKLASSLRLIQDWPFGKDKKPFKTAYPRRHPDVPSDPTTPPGN